MELTQTFDIHVEFNQRGSYFRVPFDVPPDTERIRIAYQYDRRPMHDQNCSFGKFHSASEMNIIDLGLIDPHGVMTGASGSDKTDIYVSEYESTPGYSRCIITPGQWEIMVGVYQVAKAGVDIHYQVTTTPKQTRLFRGDLHVHTLASDGVHTPAELAMKAHRNGLDFIAITDHNQMVSEAAIHSDYALTMIPGVEWTHYRGHVNFIGIEKPYDSPFAANSLEEIQSIFQSANQRGALISLNHPFAAIAPFELDPAGLPYDCIEIWNGPMREDNLKAIGYWHNLCASGKKVPITSGSDYHKDTPFLFLGGPSMGVYAASRGTSDLLSAIRQGHAFLTFAPNGPSIQLMSGELGMGDSIHWTGREIMQIKADNLMAGDIIRMVTASDAMVLLQTPSDGSADLEYPITNPGFARIEILRNFLPGIPSLPALISNPIYFEP